MSEGRWIVLAAIRLFAVIFGLTVAGLQIECTARQQSTDIADTNFDIIGGCFVTLQDGTTIHVDDYWIEGQR